jgi:hypothetical protein
MTPSVRRMIGILFLIAAAVVAILNLKRVANLGLSWMPAILIVLGTVLVGSAARRKQ